MALFLESVIKSVGRTRKQQKTEWTYFVSMIFVWLAFHIQFRLKWKAEVVQTFKSIDSAFWFLTLIFNISLIKQLELLFNRTVLCLFFQGPFTLIVEAYHDSNDSVSTTGTTGKCQ